MTRTLTFATRGKKEEALQVGYGGEVHAGGGDIGF
jgi:hypothetical protein